MGKQRWFNPDNRKVLAFTREYEGQTILIVCNLSRFAQPAVLDLREYEGQVPVELIGETPFPRISGSMPYQLTLGPYMFLWFRLEKPAPGRGMP
jgi:maltose alpha-D-glucosyltransferase/alpha-amylase